MNKTFSSLLKDLPEARRKKIALKTSILVNELALRELREALDLTQQDLANRLNLKQAAISKFESQSDLYISTLRKILFAMGAELRITARFPTGEVAITQFNDVHETEARSRPISPRISKNIHVVQRDDGWAPLRAGASKTEPVQRTQAAAVLAATAAAKREGGEVRIHARQGQIRERQGQIHERSSRGKA